MKDEEIELNTAILAWEKGFPKKLGKITQSLLQRWLREECTIEVLVYKISNIKDQYTTIFCSRHYKTYEQALEEGLYEALKLIKHK